jgi:Tfp pilus assembly protein PilZ
MKNISNERRKSQRYDTVLKVYYQVAYDVKTKVKFQVLHVEKQKAASKKYSGISKNVSVDGLCFVSKKKLEKGDSILLEVYTPNTKTPIHMRGEVKWVHTISGASGTRTASQIGVEIVSVEGKSVSRSLHYDKKYQVAWSIVLDSLFGNFKTMVEHCRRFT